MTLLKAKISEGQSVPVTLDEFSAPDEGRVSVAVSGGPDSMALCWLLSQWAQAHERLEIHAVTVDHGLRREAAEEARMVGLWLKDMPHVKHVTLTAQQEEGGVQSKVMELAREWRYELLSDYCQQHKIKKLYVAHHLDDQAETFLFRLAKGSGLDGLAAMRTEAVYDQYLTLVRPLLSFCKERLIATCDVNGIPYVSDPSNENDRFARVRLRQSAEVLAEEGLTAKRLAVTARRLNRAREALDVLSDRIYQIALCEQKTGALSFVFSVLKAEPEEVRLRVLKKALEVLKNDRSYGPRTEKFENLVGRLFNEESFVSATLGGCLFALDRKNEKITVKVEGNRDF